jgi:hypothetical protein
MSLSGFIKLEASARVSAFLGEHAKSSKFVVFSVPVVNVSASADKEVLLCFGLQVTRGLSAIVDPDLEFFFQNLERLGSSLDASRRWLFFVSMGQSVFERRNGIIVFEPPATDRLVTKDWLTEAKKKRNMSRIVADFVIANRYYLWTKF